MSKTGRGLDQEEVAMQQFALKVELCDDEPMKKRPRMPLAQVDTNVPLPPLLQDTPAKGPAPLPRMPVRSFELEELDDPEMFEEDDASYEIEQEDSSWRPATVYRHRSSTAVVFSYSMGDDDEYFYEGLCGTYTLADGVLRDGDGEAIPHRRSCAVSEWVRLRSLFEHHRKRFILRERHLFEAFTPRRALQRLERDVGGHAAARHDTDMEAFRQAHRDTLPAAAGIREYQAEGVRWMLGQHASGAGIILGDEMGLGKTMQAILFMAAVSKHCPLPHAVVAPVSVIGSWVRELERWWPDCRVVILHGAARGSLKRGRLLGDDFDVVLTSPETLRAEKTWYGHKRFHLLVFDEAHKTKNDASEISRAARRVRCLNRLLLTGTPVQNNTHEIFSLLNLLFPEAFTDAALFDSAFNLLQDNVDLGLLDQVAAALGRVMLRRTKANVGLDIPPKTVQTVYVEMGEQQRFWYKALLTQQQALLLGQAPGQKRALLNLVMQLRKCCNHPYQFAGAEPHPYYTGEHVVQASGKFTVLDKMLRQLLDAAAPSSPRKVVIFSNFVLTLDLLEELLNLRGYAYLRLDGQTPRVQRQLDVEDFQRPGSPFQVYLVSTAAGGLGLTLTAASTVVLFDSHYNPQVDKQAMDRVHRIGQTRPVAVYRLVCRGTAEEGVLLRAGQKLVLDAAVMGGDARAAGGAAATECVDPGDPRATAGLQPEALLGIVMHGVGELLQAADGPAFHELSWEAVLQRSRQLEAQALSARGPGDRAQPDTATLQAMLRQRATSCRLFDGAEYRRLQVAKPGSCRLKSNEGELRIADAWQAQRDQRPAPQGRMAAIEMGLGLGKLGEVPERHAVECNIALDKLRKPSNCFTLFVGERAKASRRRGVGADMAVVAEEWRRLPGGQRAAYEQKAARDRERFLRQAAEVISVFGTAYAPGGAAPAPKGKDWQNRSACLMCDAPGGELLPCGRCPVSLCPACLPASAELSSHRRVLTCGHHRCSVCLAAPSACGGALLCCTACPRAFCLEHRPAGSVVTRECEWAERLGFEPPVTMIYFECNQCDR